MQPTVPGPDLVSAYDEAGYVVVRGVIDRDLVAEAEGHVAWLQQKHPDVRPEQLGHEFVKDDPFWVRLVGDERLLGLVERFLGPDLALFASHYICKPPFSGQPVLWHQDGCYWPLEPMRVITAWLAIDPSTPENGCLRVIPGSHRAPLSPAIDSTEVDNVLGSTTVAEVDEDRAVDLVLAPGDVEIHHPGIMHGSRANTSPHRRCGLTIRYIPTSTRIVSEQQPYPSAFLLKGGPGANLYQERPRYRAGEHYPFAGSDLWA